MKHEVLSIFETFIEKYTQGEEDFQESTVIRWRSDYRTRPINLRTIDSRPLKLTEWYNRLAKMFWRFDGFLGIDPDL